MKTKLSDFLKDLRDSDNIIGVKESQLRKYVIQCKGWERLADEQMGEINALKRKIKTLEASVSFLKEENKQLKSNFEEIDLFA